MSCSSTSSSKRIARTPEDLVFYTNTDEARYPIFVTSDGEVWLKARPYRKVVEEGYGYAIERKVRDVPVAATFFVREVAAVEDAAISHELLDRALQLVREVSNKEPTVKRLKICYEVYRGDMEELLGEAVAYAVRVVSAETPYSGIKCEGRKAWAIAYDWRKRLVAREPKLEKFTYVTGEDGRKGRAYAHVVIKLPVMTEEFCKLFAAALSRAPQAVQELELEGRIKELEELIKQKERELEALKEELQNLRLKLQLEKLKAQVTE